jgi:hypothetical protein
MRRQRLFGFVLGMQLVSIGCDPGMMIQQVNVQQIAGVSHEERLMVRVKTIMPLTSETTYSGSVELSNNYSSSVSISNIQLSVRGKTYKNECVCPDASLYPITLGSGATKTVGLLFQLDRSVWKTFFKQRADLLVEYKSGTESSEEKVARATIVGTHLDGSP